MNACAACSQGDIRLVAGARDNEGRVEVCNQNQWGSICDIGWGLQDARVACYQAGYSGTAASETINLCLWIGLDASVYVIYSDRVSYCGSVWFRNWSHLDEWPFLYRN